MKMKPDGTGRWYVTWYNNYPIYEPAEGGYYYTGSSGDVCYVFTSRKKVIRYCSKLIKELEEHAEIRGWKFYKDKTNLYARASGKYIGDGAFVILERTPYQHESGRVPYC